MTRRRDRGFTLIELLTVIAIIAILASITFAAFPRVREYAQLRRMNSAMIDLRTQLTQYYAEHGSYPPAYGYLVRVSEDPITGEPELGRNNLPYMARLNSFGNTALYDTFSSSYDANNDGFISALEFSPLPDVDPVTQQATFPQGVYNENNLPEQLNRLAQEGQQNNPRPFFYIPVNLNQFRRAAEFWRDPNSGAVPYDDPSNGTRFLAETWDWDNPRLQQITFPPPRYDAYVLISVGPGNSHFGVIPSTPPIGPSQVSPNDPNYYHIQAMRAFFLATRDLDNDNLLDFHFEDRKAGGPQAAGAVTYNHAGVQTRNWLPETPQGAGPFIFVVK